MNKPGFVTTEFWTTLITQVLALVAILRPSLTASASPALVQGLAVVAASVGAAAYSHSRAKVKVAVGAATVAVPGPVGDSHIEPLVQR